MELYYTVSSGYNDIQSRVGNSLGGYKSSTLVRNDDLENLFGEISIRSVQVNRDEYMALVLYNNENDVTNIQCWFEFPENSQTTLQIGATLPTLDKNNNPVFERVNTVNSKPFTPKFIDASQDNPALLGGLESGKEMCLWFKRILNIDNIKNSWDNVAERDLNTRSRYKPIDHPTVENINFQIIWD